MSTAQTVQQETAARMAKAMEVLRHEFSTVRTGRASSAILEDIRVDYYNSLVPIHQVASIGIPDARTLEIKPWDISALGAIEKAILKANLGVTPVNDGKVARITFPPLTEERRRELVKQVEKMAEGIRVEIRNHRRKGMENIKALRKEKSLTEDEEKNIEGKIQKLTDEHIAQVDQLAKSKEKELMEI